MMNLKKEIVALIEYRADFERGITPEEADRLGAICLNTGVMLTDGACGDKEQRSVGMGTSSSRSTYTSSSQGSRR